MSSSGRVGRFRRLPRWVRSGLIWLVVIIMLGTATRLVLASLDYGPAQPIPFSHRVHVGTKQLSCFFCHPTPTRSSNAGMPPVEKCLLCHNVIASNFPPIAKVRAYGRMGRGMPWLRVNRLPDFVHFSHQAHLTRGFDCSACHGNVAAMDRIKPPQKIDMGFCLDCHKKNGASWDCNTCHY